MKINGTDRRAGTPGFWALSRQAAAFYLGLMMACAVSWPAQAQWSSLRANNRSAPAQRAAPRGAPPAARGFEAQRGQPAREAARPAERGEAQRGVAEHGGFERGRVERGEVEHGRVGEPRATGREFFGHEEHERQRWDLDEDRYHAYPWFGINPGFVISTLPPGYDQVYVGGNPYYYDQGLYYQPGASGYVVVSPPIGAMVPQLPPGAEPIQAGAIEYYYAGGAFYVQQPQGFLVVTPPPGISITTLPPGAAPVAINGTLYYQADGAYFLPMFQNGITVYTTVQPP